MPACLWWLLVCLLAACGSPPLPVQQIGGPTMGSTWSLKYVGAQDPDAVRALVEPLLAEVDATFSQWRPDSELSRCNGQHSREPFPVSTRLHAALALALRVAAATDGAFDPTVKPLSDVYRAAKASGRLDDAALAAARTHVDWRRVHLRDGAVCKDDPELQLDLDGLVAGLAADELATRLQAAGLQAFLLDLTGEYVARGEKAPGAPWTVGVVDPDHAEWFDERPLAVVALRERALCTSGDYRNFVATGGRRWHHIFDPRTGANATHDTVSVAVHARSAALADALATAFMVRGPEAAATVLQRVGGEDTLGVLFVHRTGDGRLRQERLGWPE